jgi:hypothetical protein
MLEGRNLQSIELGIKVTNKYKFKLATEKIDARE